MLDGTWERVVNINKNLFLLISALGATSVAQANVVNGGFESFGGSGNSNIGQGLTGWTISGGGIDIVNTSYWQSGEGVTSISLGWTAPATISQTVATTAGQAYDLSFLMAAEIFGGSALRTMDVLWNGNVVSTPSFAYTGQGPTNMGWTLKSVGVVGTGSDLLEFRSTTTTQSNYGPALDGVRLTAVPEPASLTALALGAIAFLRKRRK